MVSLRNPCNVFHIQMQSVRRFRFGCLFTTTRNASNEEKKKNQDNCSWPSWRGILQSCKTKAASSEEWMIQWIGLKAATSILGEHVFRKYIPFTQRRNLKILGYAEKNDFKLLRKFLLLRSPENLVDEKKGNLFECLVSVSQSLICRFWMIFWEKSSRKLNDIAGKNLKRVCV